MLGISLIAIENAQGAAQTWGNTGTDFNASASWNAGAGPAPDSNGVGLFTTAPTMQPNVTADLTIAGLRFSDGSSGYDFTNSGGAVLTLNGVDTTGSGGTTTASATAFRNDNTSGTTTVDAPLNLAPSTGISTIYQASGDGSTLILNGDIGQTGTVHLSLKNGTIQLNGNNSFTNASIDAAGTTVVVGNNNGLGAGTFTINSTSALQAGGGARTLPNSVVVGGTTTISGSNAITFNGSVTSSGSSSRTLTVSNTGGVTFGGTVNLEESGAPAGRAFTINGTSAVNMNGTVQDGSAQPALLKYTGSNTLTLNNANTYSGGTQETIAGSTIVAAHDGALGTGNISLTTTGVTLTLQGGSLNDYINNNAILSFVTGDTVNLNFSGVDVIGGLTVDGVMQGPGLYGAGGTNPDSAFTGNGFLQIVPEPGTWLLLCLGAGLLGGVQRLRRKHV